MPTLLASEIYTPQPFLRFLRDCVDVGVTAAVENTPKQSNKINNITNQSETGNVSKNTTPAKPNTTSYAVLVGCSFLVSLGGDANATQNTSERFFDDLISLLFDGH